MFHRRISQRFCKIDNKGRWLTSDDWPQMTDLLHNPAVWLRSRVSSNHLSRFAVYLMFTEVFHWANLDECNITLVEPLLTLLNGRRGNKGQTHLLSHISLHVVQMTIFAFCSFPWCTRERNLRDWDLVKTSRPRLQKSRDSRQSKAWDSRPKTRLETWNSRPRLDTWDSRPTIQNLWIFPTFLKKMLSSVATLALGLSLSCRLRFIL